MLRSLLGKEGNLHRLENSPNVNPTLETVQRLAHALGKQIRVELIDEAA